MAGKRAKSRRCNKHNTADEIPSDAQPEEESAMQTDSPEVRPECRSDAVAAECASPGEQPASVPESEPSEPVSKSTHVSKQHHVSKILDAVLEEDIPVDADAGIVKRFRYPVYFDGLLALGLLIAVAGFTVGLFKMYLNHQAQLHIMQGDYKTAITILQASPTPPVFTVDGHNPEETLSQALYLDALRKFESGETTEAWTELQQIRPGSNYFDQSQRLLTENFVPAETTLQCSITNDGTLQAYAPNH